MNEPFQARVAAAYDQHSESYASILDPTLQPMADEIVGRAGVTGGERALDLATGTGLTARTLARAGASVVGTDISVGMLARAQALSKGEISLTVGDAHKIPFRSQCFHLVTCGLSLTHFSDVAVALAEVRRVLRPGGQFITSAWGSESQNPSKAAAVEVRNRFVEDMEVAFRGALGEEAWANVEKGCEILKQAAFGGVEATTITLSGTYRDEAEATEIALAWPLTRYRIARLDPADQRELREETAAAILKVDDLSWCSEIHVYAASRPPSPRAGRL